MGGRLVSAWTSRSVSSTATTTTVGADGALQYASST